jgi:hypothetical protein
MMRTKCGELRVAGNGPVGNDEKNGTGKGEYINLNMT